MSHFSSCCLQIFAPPAEPITYDTSCCREYGTHVIYFSWHCPPIFPPFSCSNRVVPFTLPIDPDGDAVGGRRGGDFFRCPTCSPVAASSTSGSHVLQVEGKDAAIAGRGDNRLRGARSHSLTPPLPPTSPGWSHGAGLGAGSLRVAPSEGNIEPDAGIGHERIAEVSRALREDDQNSLRQSDR